MENHRARILEDTRTKLDLFCLEFYFLSNKSIIESIKIVEQEIDFNFDKFNTKKQQINKNKLWRITEPVFLKIIAPN